MIRIPVAAPLLRAAEARATARAVRSGWIGRGPEIAAFERAVARAAGTPDAAAVSSGTAALEAAVRALGLEGREILTGAASCAATANALLHAGCRLVLVDHSPDDLQMDVEEAAARIGRRTAAIVAVHLYGTPCRIDRVAALARRRRLVLIEDCAQALGARWRGRPVGTFGDAAILSFYANKGVTTGEGGAVCGPRRLADRVRLLRDYGQDRPFHHVAFAPNWRMPNVLAAIGRVQIRRLPEILRRRRAVAALLQEALADEPALVLPRVPAEAVSARFCFPVLLRRGTAAPVRRRLADLGVETRPLFGPMCDQPYWTSVAPRVRRRFPVAEDLARRGFYVSTSPTLTRRDVEFMIRSIRRAVRGTA